MLPLRERRSPLQESFFCDEEGLHISARLPCDQEESSSSFPYVFLRLEDSDWGKVGHFHAAQLLPLMELSCHGHPQALPRPATFWRRHRVNCGQGGKEQLFAAPFTLFLRLWWFQPGEWVGVVGDSIAALLSPFPLASGWPQSGEGMGSGTDCRLNACTASSPRKISSCGNLRISFHTLSHHGSASLTGAK